jgi:hypothetical protein
MARVEVSPGVCGLKTTILAQADDMYDVAIEIVSECERVQRLAEDLVSVSALSELRQALPETAVYQAAGRAGLHVACPVPSAVLKAVEVAAGLALPADVQIVIRR